MMKQGYHVVLGGAGAIGQAVIDVLLGQGRKVVAVERTKTAKRVETMKADLLNQQACLKAISGATHVYVCIGVPYFNALWKTQWPIIIDHVIEACHQHNAKLIFLDNVYMYGPTPLPVPMNETTSQLPTTPKGLVRKEIANRILKADSENKIKAVIGRSADFYGPRAVNSSLYIQFIENVLKHKNPSFLGKKGVIHTYAYTDDVAQALVMLALEDSCYGKAWHLPVGRPVTIDEIIGMINQVTHRKYEVAYVPNWLLGILQLFNPIIREAAQMLYMFNYPYVMDDRMFKTKFPNFKVTDYLEGLEKTINSFEGK
jgi:nucleoside-diphosphate-sugar epimerase